MTLRCFIGHLLAVFVIAGLVVAPLASPVAATEPSSVAMSDMASMSSDMPCCPDTQKNKDCKDCPLLAICMLKNLAAHPAVEAVVLRPARHHRFIALDDVMSDGLDRPPPDHPPRTLV
jgi:hypothetical protein